MQTLPAWLQDHHALASQTIVEVADAELGPTRQPGFAALLSRSPPTVRWGRGARDPAPGQDTDWLGAPWQDPACQPGTGAPLLGVRVVDCSSLLAGPTTARVLAQYGADVVKIDNAAIAGNAVDSLSDDEFAFIGARTVNAGKRMIFLDLKMPEGQEVLRDLVGRSDIVHHNFTPDAALRLGVSGDQLRRLNPQVILSTMSLHSHGGFRAEYRGHDMLGQMITGMGHRAGGDGPPQVIATVLNDNAAGHLHAFGLMLALLYRLRSGAGQDVNSSLSRTATLHQLPFMVGFAGRVWNDPAGPDARGWHALDRLYRARDGWFYLAAGQGDGSARLRRVQDLDGVAAVAPDALATWLQARFAALPVSECVSALVAAGIADHRHLSLIDLAADPGIGRRGYLAVAEHPGIGRALGIGLLYYGEPTGAPPLVLAARRPGLDTLDVLTELGYADRLPGLLTRGIAATGEDRPIVNQPQAPGFWAHALRTPPGGLAGLVVSEALVEHIARTQAAQTR